ncbi:MAG: polysaccharide biosynthesis/export family protein [Cyclobacteriaceae bacterium]
MLQKNDVNSVGLTTDKVVRSYAIDSFTYKIQSNDIVSVRFESLTSKDYDFLSSQSIQGVGAQLQGGNALLIGELVNEAGEIPIPLIGKFKVEGLTVFEAENKLQALAVRYGIQSPIVRVRLINYRITLLGEVNKEGTTFLTTNRVSMLEAIGLAGGLGELADRSKVKLIRQRGNQTEVVYLNLLEEEFFKSPYYYTYQNDVLIVPALRQRSYRKYFGQNLAVFVSTVSVILLTLNLLKN